MNITPTADRILVRPFDPESITESGLVIPDIAQEKSQTGEVLAVGVGRTLENGDIVPPEPRLGDTVIYSKYGGTEIEYNGEKLLILSDRDVLAVKA